MAATKRSAKRKRISVDKPVRVVYRYDKSLRKLVPATDPIPMNSSIAACWPMVSNNAAVLPRQVSQVNALLQKKGARFTEHDKLGRPIFRDRSHRSEYLRARGFCDLDAGYRDPAPLRYDGRPD